MQMSITTSTTDRPDKESGVSHMLEYLIITGIVILLFMIMVPMVTEAFIRGPTEQLTESAYTDIGNGVSTRIIDLYAIIPYYNEATIKTKFDIPDDVAGRDYWVSIEGTVERRSAFRGIRDQFDHLAGRDRKDRIWPEHRKYDRERVEPD